MFQETLNLLQVTSSTKEKESILVEALLSPDADILHRIFDTASNYTITTYLTDINLLGEDFIAEVSSLTGTAQDYSSATAAFQWIHSQLVSGRRFLRKEWSTHLLALAVQCNKEQFQWFVKALTKDLVCGASIGLFNRALAKSGNTSLKKIPEWDCMKVSSIDSCKINPKGSYVAVKKDGVNATCICSQGSWSCYTRSGQLLTLPHLEDFLTALQEGGGFPVDSLVICGELVSSTRQKTSGIINSNIKLGSSSKLPCEDLDLYVFDVISKSEYESALEGKSPTTTFSARLSKYVAPLRAMLADYYGSPIKILEQYPVNTIEEVYHYYNLWTSEDENCEGIIWNDKEGLFEFKRSKKRARIKAELEADFAVTGWEPLKDNESLVGSLQLRTGCGKLVASVGTGLKDLDRQALYQQAKEGSLVGSIVQVKYNKVIPHSSEELLHTLFLPVFLQMRDSYDKSTADSLEEIKHF